MSFTATTTRLLVDPVLAVVFPSTCPACGEPLAHPTAGPLCEPCWETLPRHVRPLCPCGVPLAPGCGRCGRCRRDLQPFAAGASLGPYVGALRALVHALKYEKRRRVARRLAQALAKDPAVAALLTPGAILLPVPLHPRRRRERGFNQSELLSEELARLGPGLAVCPGALVRRKDTPAQAGLSAAARRQNVAGAFAVRRRSQVAARVVVLVDDVVTTGATALACARVLREAGVAELRLLSVARVV